MHASPAAQLPIYRAIVVVVIVSLKSPRVREFVTRRWDGLARKGKREVSPQ